ncbi:MAG: hypothetical protein LUF92_17590 [Clostridiales bacterium]|nr:hypothetical protein [Clostridiales bacterium]
MLSTKGENSENVPEELVAFQEYVAHPGASSPDDYTRLLDDKIVAIKRNWVWEARYMLFEEMMRDEREEGRKEGLEEFKNSILSLLQDFGEVPEDIQLLIMNEDEGSNLKELNRMAARAESLDDFRSRLEKWNDK